MATVFGIDHKYFAVSTIAISAGVAVYATYRLMKRSRDTSDYYETRKLLHEYLLFHYGQPKEILAYEDFGPNDSLDFPKRCAELCLRHYKPGMVSVVCYCCCAKTHVYNNFLHHSGISFTIYTFNLYLKRASFSETCVRKLERFYLLG